MSTNGHMDKVRVCLICLRLNNEALCWVKLRQCVDRE